VLREGKPIDEGGLEDGRGEKECVPTTKTISGIRELSGMMDGDADS
jgi:hypothetical protein